MIKAKQTVGHKADSWHKADGCHKTDDYSQAEGFHVCKYM
jgi:hypothetical protein